VTASLISCSVVLPLILTFNSSRSCWAPDVPIILMSLACEGCPVVTVHGLSDPKIPVPFVCLCGSNCIRQRICGHRAFALPAQTTPWTHGSGSPSPLISNIPLLSRRTAGIQTGTTDTGRSVLSPSVRGSARDSGLLIIGFFLLSVQPECHRIVGFDQRTRPAVTRTLLRGWPTHKRRHACHADREN
jgi:hypothetical protein